MMTPRPKLRDKTGEKIKTSRSNGHGGRQAGKQDPRKGKDKTSPGRRIPLESIQHPRSKLCGKLHYVILHFLPANKSTNQGNQRIWMELYDTTRPVKVFSFRPKVVVRCSLKLPVLDILCNCCFWRCSKPQPTGAKSGRNETKSDKRLQQGLSRGQDRCCE